MGVSQTVSIPEQSAISTLSDHPADRLLEAINRHRAPVCVGIDPVVERLPRSLIGQTSSPADMIQQFSVGVCEAVAGIVPCVKFQSACFERYGSRGFRALEESIACACRLGLVVILDAKRGDIGISAEHYAAAAFDSPEAIGGRADWVTLNPYLGSDSVIPFLNKGGAFALVRTSNASGDVIQQAKLESGGTVALHVAAWAAELGSGFIGASGYSSLGAVVGATKSAEISQLRKVMPQQLFLVPGFGAQGGGIDDVLECFHSDGRGAVVTASRSVIYSFGQAGEDWQLRVRDAAEAFAEQIGCAVGLRSAS